MLNINKTAIKSFVSSSIFLNNLVSIFLIVALCSSTFAIGMLWTKVQYLEKSGSPAGVNPAANVGAAPEPQVDLTNLTRPNKEDHILGNKNAQVALIEYTDLQCPFCRKFKPTIDQIMANYGDKLMYVPRHFPLASIHPYAQKMAEAAECAFKLGGDTKFWEFTNKLYADFDPTTGAQKYTDADLPGIAAGIGLNQAAVKSCIDSGEMTAKVNADYEDGLKWGVSGTPSSFVINLKTGAVKAISGALPYDQVKSAVDSVM